MMTRGCLADDGAFPVYSYQDIAEAMVVTDLNAEQLHLLASTF